MKLNSIRFKVASVLFGCMCAGLLGTLALMQYSFGRDAQILAEQSVKSSQNLFNFSEAREINKMATLTELLNANPEFGDTLLAQDRDKLIALTAPLFLKLRNDGITNWSFHSPRPNMAVFLRLHEPGKYGDQLNRYMDEQVADTMTLVSGNDLGRAGFAVRTIAPMFGAHGEVAGFVEFGEELGQFLHAMKDQTGDDYGLVLDKKYLNRQFWADSSAALNHRDNWDDDAKTVVLDKTSASPRVVSLRGDLSAVPANGEVLERYREGKSVFVRGAFPIMDAAGEKVGAVFVVRDVSALYYSMRRTEIVLTIVMLLGIAISGAALLSLLDRLVFRRLERIIAEATNVVGGDFETEIKIRSDDEVGQLENLFEQFRCVFIGVLEQVPGLREK